MTSRHFVLQTDLREAEARATGDDLERLYTLLDTVVFRGYRGSKDQTTVVVFAEDDELNAFSGERLRGWYSEKSALDLERAPTIVMRGGPEGGARTLFLHELTHRLMHRTFGYIPTWFNEGFAEYFSTVQVRGGYVVLGELVSGLLLNATFIPDVHDLVTASPERFYGHESHRYYAGAWSLAHFLQNDGTVRPAFDAFAAQINAGERIDVAWDALEASMGKERLEAAFRAYLDRTSWQSHGQAIALPRAEIVDRVRLMSDEEVHLRWARTFRASDVDTLRDQLDTASRHAGDSAEVRYWRGCYAFEQKDYAAAEATFRALQTANPGEPRSAYGLLMALELQPKANPAEIEALAQTLRERGTTADELNGAASVLGRRKNFDAADALVTRSLSIDPGYWQSLVLLGRIRFAQGRATEAADALQKGISHRPEGGSASALVRDLGRYKEAAAAQKRNESPAP